MASPELYSEDSKGLSSKKRKGGKERQEGVRSEVGPKNVDAIGNIGMTDSDQVKGKM